VTPAEALADIATQLHAHPNSVLAGEHGLAAATYRQAQAAEEADGLRRDAEARCRKMQALPNQPPPKPGHGDVMQEVIDSGDVERAVEAVAPGGWMDYLSDPVARYHLALALAAAQARELGVDLRVAFQQRHAQALIDHGTPLQRDDGRDFGVDSCQEQIDAAVYTRAMWPEGDGDPPTATKPA